MLAIFLIIYGHFEVYIYHRLDGYILIMKMYKIKIDLFLGNTKYALLFCHHQSKFNRIFMIFRVGFELCMFSNERLTMSRAFRRVLKLFCVMPTTQVMSEILKIFKVLKGLKTF